MHKNQMNFIENILMIKDFKSAMKYHYFEFKDWISMLGKPLFMRYLKLIAELTIIWDLTLGKANPIPYKDYYEMKDRSYGYIISEMTKRLDLSTAEPSTTPIISEHPIISNHPIMTEQPPPYT